MTEPSLIFPADEFRGRVARLQAEMGAQGLDALFLTTAADIFYVTGFLTRFWESPARPWFVIVPQMGAPVAVIPSIGAELMGRCWIRDVRMWDAPFPGDDGVSLLAEVICDLLPKRAQIGVPSGLETHVRMPVADYARVAAAIAPRAFVDGTSALQRVREIKSAAEIAKIRTTCGVADRAFARVPEFARIGAPPDQVFRDFQVALLQEGADWVSYVAGAAGPGGYGDVISPASSVPLAAGDVVMLDTGAVKDGYFCDFDRNYAVGPLAPAAARAQEALWQATERVLAELRPGMRASAVHRMFVDALEQGGVTPGGGRLGHGLGVTLTEWPSFTPHDQTELRAGMVLTLEPGAMTDDGQLIVHEENIVLREGGAELLSARAPQVMQEIGA